MFSNSKSRNDLGLEIKIPTKLDMFLRYSTKKYGCTFYRLSDRDNVFFLSLSMNNCKYQVWIDLESAIW